jgi:hypothetical protein
VRHQAQRRDYSLPCLVSCNDVSLCFDFSLTLWLASCHNLTLCLHLPPFTTNIIYLLCNSIRVSYLMLLVLYRIYSLGTCPFKPFCTPKLFCSMLLDRQPQAARAVGGRTNTDICKWSILAHIPRPTLVYIEGLYQHARCSLARTVYTSSTVHSFQNTAPQSFLPKD